MNTIFNYINIYDDVMSIIKDYQNKKQLNQILTISIINNKNDIIVDIGTYDLSNNCKDIKTRVFDLGFNDYVLPRIAIRYNSWYKEKKEKIVKNNNEIDYINTSENGDTLRLVNYSSEAISYIRCLID